MGHHLQHQRKSFVLFGTIPLLLGYALTAGSFKLKDQLIGKVVYFLTLFARVIQLLPLNLRLQYDVQQYDVPLSDCFDSWCADFNCDFNWIFALVKNGFRLVFAASAIMVKERMEERGRESLVHPVNSITRHPIEPLNLVYVPPHQRNVVRPNLYVPPNRRSTATPNILFVVPPNRRSNAAPNRLYVVHPNQKSPAALNRLSVVPPNRRSPAALDRLCVRGDAILPFPHNAWQKILGQVVQGAVIWPKEFLVFASHSSSA
ncbi:hypothetical protein IFM89_033644 [Coptis chinensis]|uniref:Uncharacterized protein n=1 Tax=Coptis chinensis TaxID=261450 RepID=A0A835HRB6_9MAGN|nr:hypothetical protein IFM89_033644 [Coptis chinensis]